MPRCLGSNFSRDIKHVINSREPDKVDTLIQLVKKVQCRHIAKQASGKAGGTQNGDILTGEPLALAMLVEHPDWSDTKIAKAVGVNRTTLYDWPNFKKAKEALKQGQNDLPKGSKNSETGNMEAWD